MFSRETICNFPKDMHVIGISEKKSLLYTNKWHHHIHVYDFNQVLQRTIPYSNDHITFQNIAVFIVDDDYERVFYQARNKLYIYNLDMDQILYEIETDYKRMEGILDNENIITSKPYESQSYIYNIHEYIYTKQCILFDYSYINHNKTTNEFYFRKGRDMICTDSRLNITRHLKYNKAYENTFIPYTNHVIYIRYDDEPYICQRLCDLSIITILPLTLDEYIDELNNSRTRQQLYIINEKNSSVDRLNVD